LAVLPPLVLVRLPQLLAQPVLLPPLVLLALLFRVSKPIWHRPALLPPLVLRLLPLVLAALPPLHRLLAKHYPVLLRSQRVYSPEAFRI
jgi:hypothetical protein